MNTGDDIGTGYRYELLGDDGNVRTAYALYTYADAPTYDFYQQNYLIFDGPTPDPNVTFTVTDPSPYFPQTYNALAAVCLCAGSSIRTANGDISIENLKVGDYVETADHGMQPIRWIGGKKLNKIDLIHNPKLHPICITAGALGKNLPHKNLLVSRQHRMLLSSSVKNEPCDKSAVLVAAIRLIEHPGIYIDQSAVSVDYYHILFDHHEIIFANDTPTESLLTGAHALKTLSSEAYCEIVTLFPEITNADYCPESARLIPSRKQQKTLAAKRIHAAVF